MTTTDGTKEISVPKPPVANLPAYSSSACRPVVLSSTPCLCLCAACVSFRLSQSFSFFIRGWVFLFAELARSFVKRKPFYIQFQIFFRKCDAGCLRDVEAGGRDQLAASAVLYLSGLPFRSTLCFPAALSHDNTHKGASHFWLQDLHIC